ncbi:4Fe-4S binding protein [Oceanispirochaeta sp. M1]|nr:4Fe-4S binding protein [Oceanispirochaeta sp. M1]
MQFLKLIVISIHMKKSITLRVLRWTILLSILVFITVMGRLHQIIKLYPSIDAFCPFGTLESAWALIRYQSFLKRIGLSSFILLFSSIATGLIFRRSFCGNICPLGFLQELFGQAGRGVFKRRFEFGLRLTRILRFFKYIVLFSFIALAGKTLALAIRPFDPWVAYHHLGSDELFSEYLIGTIILILSLLGSLLQDRPFCRYLCPMGAFLAIPSKIGFSRIKRDDSSCINCMKCNKACPMGLDVASVDVMKSAECISCSECVNVCPVEDTLYYSRPSGKKMSAWIILGGTVLIFTMVLAVTTVTKQFTWKAESGLEKRVERLLWGPQKIREDNSLVDIIQVYQIHPSYFVQELNIENDEQFYMSFSEIGIDPAEIEGMVNTLYEEAGRDPKRIYGGSSGGCSGGH